MVDLPVVPLMPGWHTVVTLASVGLASTALIVAAIALRRHGALARQYAALMTGADGTDMAAALLALTKRASGSERRLDALEADAARTSERLRDAIQHVRVVRYSAFSDAGGDQSFAAALLDDAANGMVLSSLVSRTGVRVFAKPVIGGRSSYAMTTEEERVIAEARAGRENG